MKKNRETKPSKKDIVLGKMANKMTVKQLVNEITVMNNKGQVFAKPLSIEATSECIKLIPELLLFVYDYDSDHVIEDGDVCSDLMEVLCEERNKK
jgi:hypothetical protein